MKNYFITLCFVYLLLSCEKKLPIVQPIPKSKVTCDSIGLIHLDGNLARFVGKWQLVESKVLHYNPYNCFLLYQSTMNANILPDTTHILITQNGEFKVYKNNKLINFDFFSSIENITKNSVTNRISVNFNVNCTTYNPDKWRWFNDINDTLIYASFPDVNYNSQDQSIQTGYHILKKVQ